MNKTDKIYVAGHRGLVGSALIRSLENQGYTNLIMRTHEELDLTVEAEVAEFFLQEKPDYVFLAAAKVGGIHANNSYPAEFIRDNLAIQTNVIHHAYKNNVKRLLFLGSSCIYPKNAPQPLKEEYLLNGPLEETNRPYALAKIAGIEMCWSYNRQYGTQFLAVMPTNLFGPDDNYDLNNSHVLPALIRKFHLAKLASIGDLDGIEKDELIHGPIPEPLKTELINSCKNNSSVDVTVWGTGKPKREFLHSSDMADACLFIMNLPPVSWDSLTQTENFVDHFPIVNIGTGNDISIADLAEVLQELIGHKGNITFDTSKPDGTNRKLLDISRLRQLGWDNEYSFSHRLQEVYRNYSKVD
ncbi:GDP-L-fucose synthase family protein [Methylophaga sp.]|uniref:GDP-L-fucose synthase family protein n=1 Tax=Methylophaga sp. TaxID=2024840 RepID=UPI003A8CC7AC